MQQNISRMQNAINHGIYLFSLDERFFGLINEFVVFCVCVNY